MPLITIHYTPIIKRRETLKTTTHSAYGPYALCVVGVQLHRRHRYRYRSRSRRMADRPDSRLLVTADEPRGERPERHA